MPGDLDGLEVTRRLRATDHAARLPILLLTAQTADDDVAEGFAAGANDYLAKPFGAGDLVVRVEALLAASGSS